MRVWMSVFVSASESVDLCEWECECDWECECEWECVSESASVTVSVSVRGITSPSWPSLHFVQSNRQGMPRECEWEWECDCEWEWECNCESASMWVRESVTERVLVRESANEWEWVRVRKCVWDTESENVSVSESESVSVSVSVGASPLQADPAFTLYRQGMRTPRVSSLTADWSISSHKPASWDSVNNNRKGTHINTMLQCQSVTTKHTHYHNIYYILYNLFIFYYFIQL